MTKKRKLTALEKAIATVSEGGSSCFLSKSDMIEYYVSVFNQKEFEDEIIPTNIDEISLKTLDVSDSK